MIDQQGRLIDYLRISITDRCNLRCQYCMPGGVIPLAHQEILTYEEILRLCRSALDLGITKFKITGGEPLVRLGALDFMAALKGMPGVEAVTLTTNGVLLSSALPRLKAMGIDGINISLDAADATHYDALTGVTGRYDTVVGAIETCVRLGIPTKINCVLLADNAQEILGVAAFSKQLPVTVRFIEVMPIGLGGALKGPTAEEALAILRGAYGDLTPSDLHLGNGPAHYYKSSALKGHIGIIDAVSHRFCSQCNRVRLTSTGVLKPCLCYDMGTDLRALLRGGADDDTLKNRIKETISNKPEAHCFDDASAITEHRTMNAIGG